MVKPHTHAPMYVCTHTHTHTHMYLYTYTQQPHAMTGHAQTEEQNHNNKYKCTHMETLQVTYIVTGMGAHAEELQPLLRWYAAR